MKWINALVLMLLAESVSAQAIIARRHIAARAVITAEDVVKSDMGYRSDLSEIIGKEARVSIYKGREITKNDVVAPAIVERNQQVELVFALHQLSIHVSGRALQRGALGERIRVMNSASKKTLQAVILSAGKVMVEGEP